MPGTLDELSCVSPTPTTSSSGAGDGLHDARVRSLAPFLGPHCRVAPVVAFLSSSRPSLIALGKTMSLFALQDYNGRSWSRHSRSSSALDRHSESSESLDNHSTSSGTGGRPVRWHLPLSSLRNEPSVKRRRLALYLTRLSRPIQMHDFGSSEYIPTRSSKVSPKVAYNPMQFVKTGPAKLVNSAHEQLRKAEEVKKIREVRKDDAEDWQSVSQRSAIV